MTTDDRLNSIIVKGTQSEMELAAKLISKLDVRTQEVLIEAFVVEASDNWQQELGVCGNGCGRGCFRYHCWCN